MPINSFPLGPLDVNCYVVHRNGQAVVVDPGGDPQAVRRFLEENALALQAILLTHLHFDHIYGVAALQQATGAPVLAPEDDAFLRETATGNGGLWGFPTVAPFDFAPLREGEQRFGDLACTVLATPGHSPGSRSLYFPEEHALLCGDLLFYRSVGRTDLEGGDADTLQTSLREKVFALPGDTRVFPGHGIDTTVDDERRNNPFYGAFAR